MEIDITKPDEWKELDKLSPKPRGGDCLERYVNGDSEFYIVVDSGALVNIANGDEINKPPGVFRFRHDARVVFR